MAFFPIDRDSRRSPAKRVRREKEEQGSGRSFRRQAETETSGLCDDEPPWAKSLAARTAHAGAFRSATAAPAAALSAEMAAKSPLRETDESEPCPLRSE